jgi:RNase P/RNase MRP subunit POP5
MSLIGTLGEIPFAEVLRLFMAGRKTGLLSASAAGHEALLRLERGAVVHAVCGRLAGDAAVLDLFGWTEGQLSFVPEDKAVDRNVTRGTEALIEEGLRRGPLLHRMHSFFTSERLVFQMAARPPDGAAVSVAAAEWAVLRALDGQRELPEVIAASGLSREEALRVLFGLTEAGFLEKLELHRTLRAQAHPRFGAGGAAEVDVRLEQEWRRSMRFAEGVVRVEVRAGRDRRTSLGVAFRPARGRNIVLPRATLAELGLSEGDEVSVRPAG